MHFWFKKQASHRKCLLLWSWKCKPITDLLATFAILTIGHLFYFIFVGSEECEGAFKLIYNTKCQYSVKCRLNFHSKPLFKLLCSFPFYPFQTVIKTNISVNMVTLKSFLVLASVLPLPRTVFLLFCHSLYNHNDQVPNFHGKWLSSFPKNLFWW